MTVPAAAFQRTASSTVETTLNQMPQFVPGATGTSNDFTDGEATLDLRGLGPNSTLVLIDGRRLLPVNGDGYTDVNLIPSALIESVEVVTGGASAVYGSDAIGGVVNFKLRQEFDGVEIGGHWGQTDRGDGEEYDVTLTAGNALRRGTRLGDGVRRLLRPQPDLQQRSGVLECLRILSRARRGRCGPGKRLHLRGLPGDRRRRGRLLYAGDEC